MEKVKKQLFDKHLPEFVRQVNPVELLPSLPCLSMSSREEVERCWNNYGKSMAMQKLHENIVRRPEGWEQLVAGLRELDFGHLADLIDPDKQSPDKQEENNQYKSKQKRKKQPPSIEETPKVKPPSQSFTADTPIEKLNAKVLPILKRLDRDVGQKWDDLAGLLGFSVERVDSITAKNTKSPTWAVIGEWQAQGGATLGNLMTHLIQMERFDVLKELENETRFKLPENNDSLAAFQVEENQPPDFRNGEKNKLEQHHKFTTINFPPAMINPYVANTWLTMDKRDDPKVLQTLVQTNGASSPTDNRPVYRSTTKESSGSIGNRNETHGLASPTHDVQRTPLNGGTSDINPDFECVQMIRQESQPQDVCVYTPGVGTCSSDNMPSWNHVNKQADDKQHGDLGEVNGACGGTAIANAGEANDIGPRVSRVSQAMSVQSYPSMGNPHDIHEQANATNGGHNKYLDNINECKDESRSIDSECDSKKSDISPECSLTSEQDINSLSKEGDSIQRKADKVYHGINTAVNSASFSDATNQFPTGGNRPTVVSEELRRASHENESRDVEFNNRPTTLSGAQSSSTTDTISISRETFYTSNDESFELRSEDIRKALSEDPTQFMHPFHGQENELFRNSMSNNDRQNRQANETSSSANERENNTTVNSNGASDTAAAGREDLQGMGATAQFGSGTLHEKIVVQQKTNLTNCSVNTSHLLQTAPRDISTAATNGSSATNLNIGTTEQFGSNTLHKHMDNSNQSDLPSDSQRIIGDTQQFGSNTLHQQMENLNQSDRPIDNQKNIGDTKQFSSGTLHAKLETVKEPNVLPNFGDLLMSADNSHVSSETSELANIADVDTVRGEGFVVANGDLPGDLEMRENGLDNQEDQHRQMSLSESLRSMFTRTPHILSAVFDSYMRTNQQ